MTDVLCEETALLTIKIIGANKRLHIFAKPSRTN